MLTLRPATSSRRLRNAHGLHRLAKAVPSAREDLIKVVLGPSDIWAQTCELPHTVDLLVPVCVVRVRVALDYNLGLRGVGVLLVRYAQLVVAGDLGVRHFLPLRAADEVLCSQRRVAEHVRVGGHLDELVGGHCFPNLVEEGAVVDLGCSGLACDHANATQRCSTLSVGAMHFSNLFQSLLS